MKVTEAQEYPAVFHLTMEAENIQEASLLGRLLLKSAQKLRQLSFIQATEGRQGLKYAL